MDHTFVELAPYLMVTTIVGMVLCFQIVRMVLSPRESRAEKRERRRQEKLKRRRGKHDEPEQLDPDSLERMLDRADDLSRRVEILEEIMTEDMKKEKTHTGS
ncbi:MAG: hypothetical protein QNK37_02970 [Acidobacteriota bacterium]|nr:hypothetical protein [Acidobacteriota bacterium]